MYRSLREPGQAEGLLESELALWSGRAWVDQSAVLHGKSQLARRFPSAYDYDALHFWPLPPGAVESDSIPSLSIL